MAKGFVVVAVVLTAVIAGLWYKCLSFAPEPPQLKEGAVRVLFSGHMYALTDAGKGKTLTERMKKEMASKAVFGGDSISGDSAKHLKGKVFDSNLLQHQWKTFDELTDGVSDEIIAVPGNHDLLTRKGEPIASEMRASISARNEFDNLYGKKTIGQCSTYYLNTFDDTKAVPSFQLDEKQLQWLLDSLDKDLSDNIPCVVLFQHHRLWEIDTYTSPLKGDADQFKEIQRRLAGFPTAIICAGDLGIIEKSEIDGVTIFNVSNMRGHSGYVRLDFMDGEVRASLVEVGSLFKRTNYSRLSRLLALFE